jgi:hypothetical protein
MHFVCTKVSLPYQQSPPPVHTLNRINRVKFCFLFIAYFLIYIRTIYAYVFKFALSLRFLNQNPAWTAHHKNSGLLILSHEQTALRNLDLICGAPRSFSDIHTCSDSYV